MANNRSGFYLVSNSSLYDRSLRTVASEVIAPLLNTKDLLSLTEASKSTLYAFGRPFLLRATRKILQHVMNGQRMEAEQWLEKFKSTMHPNDFWRLLTQVVPAVESHNGRSWNAISPLQFAAWAGDLTDNPSEKYMLNMLLQFIPLHDRHHAVAQLQHVQTHGTEHGEMLSPFYDSDAMYDDCITNYPQRTWAASDRFWRDMIGGQQLLWTAYGLQEFCRDIPWNDESDFKNLPEVPRDCRYYHMDRDLIYSGSQSSTQPALPVYQSGLGVSFALRHEKKFAVIDIASYPERLSEDRRALSRLCEAKVSMLSSLIEQQILQISEYYENTRPTTEKQTSQP